MAFGLAGTMMLLPTLAPPAGASTRGPAPPATGGRAPAPARATLQAALDAAVAAGLPGAAGHVQDGRTGATATAGVVDLARPAPLARQARFRVGSITKTFVATVVLQLVEEGRLDLDRPVATWLPGVLPGGDGVTVRHLLNHTSGLPDFDEDPAWLGGYLTGRTTTPAALLAMALARPVTSSPGAGWSYSNTNYVVAGMLVEAVTGTTLEHQLRRRIFGPLGLGHTSFPSTGDIDGAHAHGYVPPFASPTGRLLDATSLSPTWVWAAGAIVSTPRDVTRFYRALLAGELLGPAMLDAMLTTVPVEPGRRYGLGILSLESPCGVVWGHDGGVPG